MQKISAGHYRTRVGGHAVELEQIRDGGAWAWTFYVETFQTGGMMGPRRSMSEAAEPWGTRAQALASAEAGIAAGHYGSPAVVR